MTTIRDATLEDIPRMVAMGQHFLRSTSYRELIADNPAQMAAIGTMLITDVNGLLLVAEVAAVVVGMIGVFIFPHHLSGERIAGEVFWWVEPAHRGRAGLRLLRAAEQWAATQQVATMQMVAPPMGNVGVMYERLGYVPTEVAYQKKIA